MLTRNTAQGALGEGLLEKVREAYCWLAQNYEQGDEVRPFPISFRFSFRLSFRLSLRL